MPLTPITGFLVIVHLTINLVVLCYNLFMSLIQKLKGERPAFTFMHWWFKKEYDTRFRRFVAYGLSTLTLGIVLGTSGLYIWISSGIAGSFPKLGTAADIMSAEEVSAGTVQNFKGTLSVMDQFAFRNAILLYPESVIDIFQAAGTEDPSVAYRADIAFELGIVADRDEYVGSFEQNIDLKKRLEEVVSSNLLSQYSPNN